jgi:hypothetical protein
MEKSGFRDDEGPRDSGLSEEIWTSTPETPFLVASRAENLPEQEP